MSHGTLLLPEKKEISRAVVFQEFFEYLEYTYPQSKWKYDRGEEPNGCSEWKEATRECNKTVAKCLKNINELESREG